MKVSFVSQREIKMHTDAIRENYQHDFVTDVGGIATQKLGLRIHFFELEQIYGKGTLGMILPEERVILCENYLEPFGKNKENLERILRFTIAHEVGHYVLHRRYMGDIADIWGIVKALFFIRIYQIKSGKVLKCRQICLPLNYSCPKIVSEKHATISPQILKVKIVRKSKVIYRIFFMFLMMRLSIA